MKEGGKRGRWLSYIIFALWILSMGLAGFFTPYFTDNIDFFKIKALHIEGIRTIPPEIVVDEVKKFKNNWLFINTAVLLNDLNIKTKNSVNSVKIDRFLTAKGVELKITIEERKPIVAVIKGDVLYFFDENGVVFQSPYIKAFKPLVYTHDIEFIKNNFVNLKTFVNLMGNSLREIYVTNLNTIAYTEDGLKITMPPLFLLDKKIVEDVLSVFKFYNIDVRTREIDVNTDGLVIIRGERVK